MFYASRAPRLRRMGWRTPIPIVPGDKRPVLSGWQRWSLRPVPPSAVDGWAAAYPDAGVGLVFGLAHGIVSIDADWTDPTEAARAETIELKILGDTPLVRVGRPPKRQRFYRLVGGGVRNRTIGALGLYVSSGQCVLYGIHPATGRPYQWPRAEPLDVPPSALPAVSTTQIDQLVDALDADGLIRRVSVQEAVGGGAGGAVRPVPGDVVERCQRALSVAEARHPTLLTAIGELMRHGYSDAEVMTALTGVWLKRKPEGLEELQRAVSWMRGQHGPDLATMLQAWKGQP